MSTQTPRSMYMETEHTWAFSTPNYAEVEILDYRPDEGVARVKFIRNHPSEDNAEGGKTGDIQWVELDKLHEHF